jgi:hypothetical protein
VSEAIVELKETLDIQREDTPEGDESFVLATPREDDETKEDDGNKQKRGHH